MFDSMKLEEAISDLFDSGMKDDTLSLLYDSNRNIKVKVKTASGLTEENKFPKLVLQGDTAMAVRLRWAAFDMKNINENVNLHVVSVNLTFRLFPTTSTV